MVYTIRFNGDKPPAYSQATSSNTNETKEIEKDKCVSEKADLREKACCICLGGIFGIALFGMFKSSLYL